MSSNVCRIRIIGEQEATTVVDFTHSKPLSVADVAALFKKNPVTVRRWFKRGLDWRRVGGSIYTTMEAINDFQTGGQNEPIVQAVVVDRETLAALKSLRSQGIVFGSEARKDGTVTTRQTA